MLRAIACSCFNIRGKHAIHGNRLNLLGNCFCVVLHMDVRMPRAQATAWMPEVEQRRSSCRMRWSGLSTACSRRGSRRLFPTPFYRIHPWMRTYCIHAVVTPTPLPTGEGLLITEVQREPVNFLCQACADE